MNVIFYQRVISPEIAEDMRQEVYFRFFKHLRYIKNPSCLSFYTTKIIFSVIFDFYRQKQQWQNVIIRDRGAREAPLSQEHNQCEDEKILNRIVLEEVIRKIHNRLDRLILRSRLAGKTYDEISEELSMTSGAAKMRFRRTVEYLRARVQ